MNLRDRKAVTLLTVCVVMEMENVEEENREKKYTKVKQHQIMKSLDFIQKYIIDLNF